MQDGCTALPRHLSAWSPIPSWAGSAESLGWCTPVPMSWPPRRRLTRSWHGQGSSQSQLRLGGSWGQPRPSCLQSRGREGGLGACGAEAVPKPSCWPPGRHPLAHSLPACLFFFFVRSALKSLCFQNGCDRGVCVLTKIPNLLYSPIC